MGKREVIIDAALSIVAEGDLRALTLPALFERAHTGAGTFYHYFDDRSALLDAMFAHCCELADRELATFRDSDAPAEERLSLLCTLLLRAYMRFTREFDFLYYSAFSSLSPCPGNDRETPTMRALASIVAEAVEEGVVRVDVAPELLVRVLCNIIASSFWGYRCGLCETNEEFAQRLAKTLWLVIENY